MEPLTLEQILLAVDGQCLSNSAPNISITSISIDSRNIEQNSLYIPIKGDKFDGHVFIEDAFNKGSDIAFTEKELDPIMGGILVYVKDTKKALMDLAAYYRRMFDIPVVAVTGSVGKTSTKDLISAVLSSKYRVHKTQGNFNNEIGLPLTIFGLNRTHDILVLEMGMNNFGEIHNLSMIANPDIAIITNIGVSHIENLGSREGILKAKCEILDGMASDGILIVNASDNMLQNLKISNKVISYGRHSGYPFFAEGLRAAGTRGTIATFTTPKWTNNLEIPGLGDHMIDNALVSIAVAQYLSLSYEEIEEGFKLYQPSAMRMDLQLAPNDISIINDVYNASPDSMKAALSVLSTIPKAKRRIAILGDMFELGKYANSLHKDVGKFIADKDEIDFLITIGDISKNIQLEAIKHGFTSDKTAHFKRQDDLIPKLGSLIGRGDLVLVKASRGMGLEKTVDEIGKVKFNES